MLSITSYQERDKNCSLWFIKNIYDKEFWKQEESMKEKKPLNIEWHNIQTSNSTTTLKKKYCKTKLKWCYGLMPIFILHGQTSSIIKRFSASSSDFVLWPRDGFCYSALPIAEGQWINQHFTTLLHTEVDDFTKRWPLQKSLSVSYWH